MSKHFAAMLLGAALPAFPTCAAPRAVAMPLVSGHHDQVLTLRPAFAGLPSAGRVKPRDAATIAVEEGRLLALWSGQIRCPEPARLDTPDLDAEWMAHAPALHDADPRRFLLARRDLRPGPDGRAWSIHLHALTDRPDALELRATGTVVRAAAGQAGAAVVAAASAAPDVLHLRLAQGRGALVFEAWGRRAGVPLPEVRVRASDLADLSSTHRAEHDLLVVPVLRKLPWFA